MFLAKSIQFSAGCTVASPYEESDLECPALFLILLCNFSSTVQKMFSYTLAD